MAGRPSSDATTARLAPTRTRVDAGARGGLAEESSPKPPIGPLRRAIVPSRLQSFGYQATTLAIMAVVTLPFLSYAFEELRINIDEHDGIVYGAQALGPVYSGVGLVMALLMPWRALPRPVPSPTASTDSVASSFLAVVRAEFHTRALYRAGGYGERLAVVTTLWLTLIALFAITSPPPVGWVAAAGTPVTWIVLCAGLVFSLLALPLGRVRHVLIDDEGNFFRDQPSPMSL